MGMVCFPGKKKIKDCFLGYLHVYFAEVRTEEGTFYRFGAIDRASNVAVAELHPRVKRVVAAGFLRRVPDQLPDKVRPGLVCELAGADWQRPGEKHVSLLAANSPSAPPWAACQAFFDCGRGA